MLFLSLVVLFLGEACGGGSSGGSGGRGGTGGGGGAGGGAAGASAGRGGSASGGGGGTAGSQAGTGGIAGQAGTGGTTGQAGTGGTTGQAGTGGAAGRGGSGGTSGTGGSQGGTGGTGGAAGTGGTGGSSCATGSTLCGATTCANLMTSATNCGTCGRDCTIDGASCSSGLCSAVQIYGNADLPFGTDNSGARSVVFDAASASVYWSGFNSYSVRRYPLDGSGAKVVWQPAAAATAGIESLVVTGGNGYWSVGGSPAVVFTKPVAADASVAPTTAFNPAARASFLRVQGGYFYWATGDYQDPSSPTMGLIYRRQISAAASDAGTAIVTMDQGNFANITALDVTTDAVYWISNAGQGTAYELRTTPLAGGTPTAVPKITGAADTAVAQSNSAPVLVPQGATLYFTRTVTATPTLNGIYRYAAGDSAPTLVVAADAVTHFVVDASNVYFLRQNMNNVFKAPITGGATGTPIAAASGYKLVAQDATYLYLLQTGCCQSTLLKVIK